MFEPVFMRLALIASIATGASLGLLGVYLVIRRIVFLGLVLANAATVGAAAAEVFNWPPEIASVAAAVAAGLGLGLLQRPRRVSAESVMGWAYAAASSAPVIILALAAAPDADTLHMLFGNLLAVSVSHAAGLVVLALVIGLTHVLFSRRFLLVTFDAEAAQVAGVNPRRWSMGLNRPDRDRGCGRGSGDRRAADVRAPDASGDGGAAGHDEHAGHGDHGSLHRRDRALPGARGVVLPRPAGRSGVGRAPVDQRAGRSRRELLLDSAVRLARLISREGTRRYGRPGSTFQTFEQYSRIERSDENSPIRATVTMASAVQASGISQLVSTASWAAAYDAKSASSM